MENIDKKQIETLIQKSFEAQKYAYAPYSKFSVGASVLTKSGSFTTA